MFDAELIGKHADFDIELREDFSGELFEVCSFDRDEARAEGGLEVVRSSLGDQFSLREEAESIAAVCFFHEMRREDNRRFAGLTNHIQEPPQIDAGRGIQSRGGLIEKEKAWSMKEALGDFDASLQSTRKSFHAVFASIADPQLHEDFVDPLLALMGVQAVKTRLVKQVFVDGQLSIETGGLKRHTKQTTNEIRFGAELVSEDGDASLLKWEKRREDAEEGRLPGTVGTEESKELPFGDIKREVIQSGAGVVGKRDILNRDRRHSSGSNQRRKRAMLAALSKHV